MSEHIRLAKTTKEHLEELKLQNKLSIHDLIINRKVKYSKFEVRLDSTGKRLSNIINTGKKLTGNRLPVTVKKHTMALFCFDRWVQAKKDWENYQNNPEYDADSFICGFLWDQYVMYDQTLEFIDSLKDNEILLLVL